MGSRLGVDHEKLRERYKKFARKVKNPSKADQVTDRAEKFVIAILSELGIDYPISFFAPPPQIPSVARQGTFKLRPAGTKVLDLAGTPPLLGPLLDTATFTFKARDSGVLVISSIDFIMEDPIAEADVTIEYSYDEQVNSVNYQCVQSDVEGVPYNRESPQSGHWKFNKIILADGDCLTITVKNTNPLACAVFSMESNMWMI